MPATVVMQIGTQIGSYEIVGRLGAGGMAEVWKARNVALGRMVAIKFLLPQFTTNADLQTRFLNEARIQARLQHPNIVYAFDANISDGRSYLVMDYVPGQSLEARLEWKKRLPIEEALAISYDVLAALEYAHNLPQGCIVHRDVKPSNILLGEDGRARLADFGIAVALNQERLTKIGTPGTAMYMSPEQIQTPRSIDRRSDLYSFGCVLYEMLTGHPPLGKESDTDFAVRRAHVCQQPEPLRSWAPEISPQLEEVVLRALNKDRNRRFSSAREMSVALKAAASTVPTRSETRPLRSSSFWRSRWFLAAGIVVAALLIALAAWQPWRTTPEPSNTAQITTPSLPTQPPASRLPPKRPNRSWPSYRTPSYRIPASTNSGAYTSADPTGPPVNYVSSLQARVQPILRFFASAVPPPAGEPIYNRYFAARQRASTPILGWELTGVTTSASQGRTVWLYEEWWRNGFGFHRFQTRCALPAQSGQAFRCYGYYNVWPAGHYKVMVHVPGQVVAGGDFDVQ